MKKSLEKHIESIFTSLEIEKSFQVYECGVDTLPEWANQIMLTHEFLICCEMDSEKEKLRKFLRKEIYQCENIIYWFEGEREEEVTLQKNDDSENTNDSKIDFLKKETRLPTFLDDFIFNQLNAEYAPDFQKFDYNLDLTEEENRKYLGTYFPRSYAESFCIFDNIFQNVNYQNILLEKTSLNVLSVGCGTGGDLIGLLTVIEKYCPRISELNIWAIDGNTEALIILEKIIEKINIQHSKKIKLKKIKSVFNSIALIDTHEISEYTFDFVLSFKMICEIISAGKGACDNSYYDFVMKFVPMLSENGLCVLLDVTTKMEHNNTYNPILKNSQVNQALRELKDYQTLLPLSCHQNEKKCTEQCFTQQKFFVSHKGKVNDISKVSYRVIGNSDFAKMIVGGNETAKYVLQRNEQSIDKFCSYSLCNEKIIDGYKLNK